MANSFNTLSTPPAAACSRVLVGDTTAGHRVTTNQVNLSETPSISPPAARLQALVGHGVTINQMNSSGAQPTSPTAVAPQVHDAGCGNPGHAMKFFNTPPTPSTAVHSWALVVGHHIPNNEVGPSSSQQAALNTPRAQALPTRNGTQLTAVALQSLPPAAHTGHGATMTRYLMQEEWEEPRPGLSAIFWVSNSNKVDRCL